MRCYTHFGYPHPQLEDALLESAAYLFEKLTAPDNELVFGSDVHLQVYFYQMVVNRIHDYYKKPVVRNTVSYSFFEGTDWIEGLSDGNEVNVSEDDELTKERYKQAKRLMATLRVEEQRSLQMEIDGVPYVEAAALLGITLSTHKSLIFQARRKITKACKPAVATPLLSDKLSQALALNEAGLNDTAAANQLGINVGAYRVRLQKARQKIREREQDISTI